MLRALHPARRRVPDAGAVPVVRSRRRQRRGRRLGRLGLRWPRIEQEWRAYASLADPANRPSFVRTLRSVVEPGGQSVSAHDRLYLASLLPTLIIWGQRDRIIPVAHAHRRTRRSREPARGLRIVRPLPAHRGAGALRRDLTEFVATSHWTSTNPIGVTCSPPVPGGDISPNGRAAPNRYGLRPGRSPHDALDALTVGIEHKKVR